ncbi:hypothetical protein [Pseudovibrio sp. SPO723]|uniref:hypothetical protein n=1 Tax=Nesiotobacter zosterae TaxID=392721 RepID=UPI0029C4C75E|nr:hypothetical protein [Pseudovibrio sp. SPO723]MDX5594089.1 hypothetical protein [Pseudovibrio sp. SPO723]
MADQTSQENATQGAPGQTPPSGSAAENKLFSDAFMTALKAGVKLSKKEQLLLFVMLQYLRKQRGN